LNYLICKLRIAALQAQVEVCRLRSSYLEGLIVHAKTTERKEVIARRLDDVLVTSHTAQLMLAILDRQVKEVDCSLGAARNE
jgi:hypothetical protein